jgi:hypothetical protein
VEAVKKAKYPWENPEMIQEQQRVGYNFRMEPETYLKIQWVLEHKGGLKSIQKLLEKATNKYLDGVIKELEGK